MDYTCVIERFFHPVLPSRELRRGGRITIHLAGLPFVLTRDVHGVASVVDGSRDVRVIERGDYLFLGGAALPDAAMSPVDFSAEGFTQVAALATRFRTPMHVAFDNFSEDEHTPWVHNFLGWRERDAADLHFESENFPDRTEVYYRGKQRPHPMTPGILVLPGDNFHNRWVTRFDPIRTCYTLNWTSTKTGRLRPVTSRFLIFFVPETEKTTMLHTLVYAKITESLRFLFPVVRGVLPIVGKSEIEDDGRFVPHLVDTPFSFEGMRLGRFDKPLVHNHALLERLYLGRVPGADSA